MQSPNDWAACLLIGKPSAGRRAGAQAEWSSTQYNASSSWSRRFSDGRESSSYKPNDRRVRPVRR